ncbi:glycosyltransferase, partial [Budvicia aquatica]|uniref:glycosyltransferase n=1 Tax=Budvicia aquatica TaxID=82979 RepID=UPI0021C39A4F
LGLNSSCPEKALNEITEKMKRPGKEVSVTVASRADAEEVLRGYMTHEDVRRQGPFRNTTNQPKPDGKKSDNPSPSDWLPGGKGAMEKKGTYHYDAADPNAGLGDHALIGDHIQIHTYPGKIIRIFFTDK